jgi:hypothetical protein
MATPLRDALPDVKRRDAQPLVVRVGQEQVALDVPAPLNVMEISTEDSRASGLRVLEPVREDSRARLEAEDSNLVSELILPARPIWQRYSVWRSP